MHIRTKEIRETVEDLDFIKKKYKLTEVRSDKRDYKTYEERLARRLLAVNKELTPLIKKAIDSIEKVRRERRGRPPTYNLELKVKILLLKHLVGWSNRQMAYMMALFSFLSPSFTNISYKTVERLYSDDLVRMVLHNMHVLMLEKKDLDEIDASGDATGYSLTIKEHYASHAQKYKNKSKKNSKKRKFIYSFKLLDIRTKMYVAYGVGFKSEKEAYYNALNFLQNLNVNFKVKSIRLDRYYSNKDTVKELVDIFDKNIHIYIIPKKNATAKGPTKWKESMYKFVNDTMSYLREYFQREQSESSFSQDKRRFGWKIPLKREDRIDTYDFCNMIWHNILYLYN